MIYGCNVQKNVNLMVKLNVFWGFGMPYTCPRYFKYHQGAAYPFCNMSQIIFRPEKSSIISNNWKKMGFRIIYSSISIGKMLRREASIWDYF